MILTANVWQRVNQLLKSGTSGYQSALEFSNDLYSVLLEILTDLCDSYEANEKVSDLMNKSGLIVTATLTSNSSGIVSFPEDHYRTFNLKTDVSGLLYPLHKINTNEEAMTMSSPIRAFNASNNFYGYCMENGAIKILPISSRPIRLTYCKKPATPVLELVMDNDDYETVGGGTIDIDLPENLFNLFCYKMLERAAVEMKEQIGLEYSQLGINKG